MKKTVYVVLGILAVVIVGVFVLFHFYRAELPGTETQQKNITIEITANNKTETITHSTDAVYVREALDELGLVEGQEAEYGLYVKTVNGITADESAEEWWRFSINGEMLSTGIETATFNDGDTIEIDLIRGYDSF